MGYISGMDFVRKRLKWAATVILAIGLVSQAAQGQPARCDAMNVASSSSAGASHMDHSADAATGSEAGSSQQHNSPASSSCIQSTLCLSHAALPEAQGQPLARAAQRAAIDCASPTIEARNLRPDSPPPKN